MKVQKISELIMTAIIFIAIVFLPSCKKSETTTPPVVVINKIAYIYKTDSTDAMAFKALLEANNCTVTLIDKPNDATTDYSSYKLIVIDNNTDGTQVTPGWSSADTAAINGSGKPILLIGVGGLQFGQKLQNTVNWGGCATGSTSSITALDSLSTLYKSPKTISLPANNQLVIYASAMNAQGLYVPVQPVAGVKMIARFPLSNVYMPVCFEKSRYGMFGFYGNFNSLTQAGKDFLVNLAFYVGNF